MTTSRKTSFLSELASGSAIPIEKRAYFQARFKNRLYNFIVSKFLEKEADGLTKAGLARRIGRKPEVVNRLLGAPGNWTLDTVSDLLLGIGAEELEMKSSSLLNRRPGNSAQGIWMEIDFNQQSNRATQQNETSQYSAALAPNELLKKAFVLGTPQNLNVNGLESDWEPHSLFQQPAKSLIQGESSQVSLTGVR